MGAGDSYGKKRMSSRDARMVRTLKLRVLTGLWLPGVWSFIICPILAASSMLPNLKQGIRRALAVNQEVLRNRIRHGGYTGVELSR